MFLDATHGYLGFARHRRGAATVRSDALTRRRNMALRRGVRPKSYDVLPGRLARMSHPRVAGETANPANIGLLGAVAAMQRGQALAQLLQQRRQPSRLGSGFHEGAAFRVKLSGLGAVVNARSTTMAGASLHNSGARCVSPCFRSENTAWGYATPNPFQAIRDHAAA